MDNPDIELLGRRINDLENLFFDFINNRISKSRFVELFHHYRKAFNVKRSLGNGNYNGIVSDIPETRKRKTGT